MVKKVIQDIVDTCKMKVIPIPKKDVNAYHKSSTKKYLFLPFLEY